jgi:hypothetical protein
MPLVMRICGACEKFDVPFSALIFLGRYAGPHKQYLGFSMQTEAPLGYAGSPLPASLLSLLPILARHGFALKVSGSASKTIRVVRNDAACGYMNGSVLERDGVLGYHFAPHGEKKDSCPPELVERVIPFFCERYHCQPSDLVVHKGGGANIGRTFLVIRTAQVALNVLLQDAGVEADETLQVTMVKEQYVEGALIDVVMRMHERSPAARAACLSEYGYTCFACKVNLRSVYAGLPVEVIHVHHEEPLSSATGQREVDPITEMKPVCPNCHAVIHSRTPPYSIAEVVAMLNHET